MPPLEARSSDYDYIKKLIVENKLEVFVPTTNDSKVRNKYDQKKYDELECYIYFNLKKS